MVALRADMDALPVTDVTEDPWVSTTRASRTPAGTTCTRPLWSVPGWPWPPSTSATLLTGRVRLVFQPAEEVMPGGARQLIVGGALDDVDQIFALHCDPAVDVGRIGLRDGPLTSAADRIVVRLEGTGGHTSRPHLTGDLTFALAKVISELPAVLSRRMDPRAGVSVVWGIVRAGAAANVIPDRGEVAGTVRILDAVAWTQCEPIIREAVHDIVRPYDVSASVDYLQGVPPVVNDVGANAIALAAVHSVLGAARLDDRPAEPRRRGLRLVRRAGPGCDDPARDAHAREVRRTTCTRATCASTSGRSASEPRCSPRSRPSLSGRPEADDPRTAASGRPTASRSTGWGTCP